MKTKKLVPILLLILLGSAAAFPKTTQNDDRMEAIDAFLKGLSEKGFAGSVLVSDGKRVFNRCYGMADRESSVMCSEDTVYDIGSVTKQFTGAAILKLEMQGRLSVDDPIGKYLKDAPEGKKSITIHQLLTHSAGFPQAIGDDYERLERTEFLKRAFAAKLQFPPGTKYDYSNVGYSILAAIIETVSGVSYEEYLNQYLFKPAGMSDTGYKLPDWKPAQIAVGYRGNERWGTPTEKAWGETAPYWNLLGNGGLLSTTKDLFKWNNALLGSEVLNEAAKAKYFKRHIEEGEGSGTFYGYGWALFPTPRNTTLITHNGGNGIFFCDFLRYTEEKITIIMLSNSMRRPFGKIPNEIARTFFVKDYKPAIELESAQMKLTPLAEHPDRALIKELISVISSGDKERIQKLVEASFTPAFKGFVPMATHLQVLSEIGEQLSKAEVEGVSVNGKDTSVRFVGLEETLEITIEDRKIAGLQFTLTTDDG